MPSSAVIEYRERIKNSVCRGLGTRACSRKEACKYANGVSRRYCRKAKNTRRSKLIYYSPKSSSRRSSRRSSSSLSFKSAKSQ
jgi:hypothetical protein